MREYDFLQSVQILALEAVLRPDWDATYRHICRWYSKTFSTALHTVEDLPTIEVLQHFFESYYEGLDDDKLEKAAVEISETPEQRRVREAQDVKSLKKEAQSVAETMERLRKTMQTGLRPADALGKMKNRPAAKTVADLQTAAEADGVGADLSSMLAAVPAAPKPRSPAELAAMPPESFQYTIGGEIPEDFDAVGHNLPKKPAK